MSSSASFSQWIGQPCMRYLGGSHKWTKAFRLYCCSGEGPAGGTTSQRTAQVARLGCGLLQTPRIPRTPIRCRINSASVPVRFSSVVPLRRPERRNATRAAQASGIDWQDERYAISPGWTKTVKVKLCRLGGSYRSFSAPPFFGHF